MNRVPIKPERRNSMIYDFYIHPIQIAIITPTIPATIIPLSNETFDE